MFIFIFPFLFYIDISLFWTYNIQIVSVNGTMKELQNTKAAAQENEVKGKGHEYRVRDEGVE